MRTFKIFALMVAATGIAMTSCQNNDSEISVYAEKSLGVQLQAVNNTYSFTPATRALKTGTLKWDTCQMYVSRVHLTATRHQGDSISTEFSVNLNFKESKLADLFNANSLLGDVALQSGIYDKISIQIQSDKKDAGNSPVFYLSGNYTNPTGTATPIALIVNKDLKFMATAKDSVQLNSAADYTALFQLDLSNYISNGNITEADLDKATLTNGKIIVSETSNAELYKKFFKRVSVIDAFKHTAFKKISGKHK
jgi:hypothetical protein